MYRTALLAALASAIGFAGSTSLQHQATGSTPEHVQGVVGLLRHLLTRPRWLLGQLLATVSFVLHALALYLGPLLLVQPVVLSGIVIAVPLRAALSRRRPPASELAAVLITAVGLTIFLVVAGDTTGSRAPGNATAALVVLVAATVAIASYALAGRGRTAAWRAGGYGAVAGLLFGVVSGMVKLTSERAADGFTGVVDAWPVLAVVGLGLFGVATNQTSYRVGSLSASMPVLNAVNVVVALALGVALFGEVPAHSTFDLLLEAAGVAAVLFGVVWSSAHAEPEGGGHQGRDKTGTDPDEGPSDDRRATPSQPVGS